MVYSDRYELDISNETIIIQNYHFSQSHDEKAAENYRNYHVAEKRIVS